MVKKSFFREPSVAVIRQREMVLSSENAVEELINLNDGQYLVINSPLLNTRFDVSLDGARKFLKHGSRVFAGRARTIEQAIADGKIPLDLRREGYDKVKGRDIDFACYSFVPLIGNDQRIRRVSLVQVLDGARIFGYSDSLRKNLVEEAQEKFYEKDELPGIKIKSYDYIKLSHKPH